jgi:hypothetical protein
MDNGGELAGSDEFQTKFGEHGYILETTSPNASSQNGLAKQPHKTLKEKSKMLPLYRRTWSHLLEQRSTPHSLAIQPNVPHGAG